MRTLDLDALLGDRHPEASFHDSELEAVVLDYVGCTARLSFAIPVALKGNGYVYRRGILELRDLRAFAAETPRNPDPPRKSPARWIVGEGPLPDPKVSVGLEMPVDLPDGAFCHYLFDGHSNSFILFAAGRARFTWHADED